MLTLLPLPAFAPDQSANTNVLQVANNVYRAVDGYRPIKALSAVSESLPEVFSGGYSAIASDGTAYLLAGTAAGLYRLDSDASWSALSSGLSVASRWNFAQFGNYVVAVNSSATREVDLAAGSAAAIAGAPSGNSVCVVGDHVVIGRAGGDLLKVAWSAFRDHTAWVVGTDQAGEQPMQTGGAIQAVCGGEYGIILQRERIVRMSRTGDASAPFQFDEISNNFGCAAGSTVAQAGRSIFFLSDRGFMALEDGQSLKPIGSEKVDRSFREAILRDDFERIFAAVDPENKLVVWGIPGTPGQWWIYNFELDSWTTASFSFSGIMPGFTTTTSLDALAVIYPDLDAMTISLDDPRWSGGDPRLYVFGPLNKASVHAGSNLAAEFVSGFAELVQGARVRIRQIRPVTDATRGLTVTLDARVRLGDLPDSKTCATMRRSGRLPLRAHGRYVAATLGIEAGTEWSYIQAIEYEYGEAGAR